MRKLGAFVALSEAEHSVLEGLHKRRRTFEAGRDLVHQGQPEPVAYILISGWACSYKLLADGERQVVDFQIPGDFLGLRSVALHISDHSIEPVTDIEVTEVYLSDLLEAFSQTPRLATAVFWAASRDEAMVVEHLVGIGRRDAAERMAHFLLELGARLCVVSCSEPPVSDGLRPLTVIIGITWYYVVAGECGSVKLVQGTAFDHVGNW